MSNLVLSKVWAMPNKNTFSIKPIKDLIEKYIEIKKLELGLDEITIIDPYTNNNKIGTIRNDLDPNFDTQYHMDATEFLKQLPNQSADIILYDPPYSTRQLSECYQRLELSVSADMTRSDYWTSQKREISRIIKPKGICLSFCWNSGGMGKSLGFEQIEIMLVAHGGWHNDTIVTVERKL